MKVQTFNKFLTNGSDQVRGKFKAIGIHPSSEVDLVDVDGYRLGVGDMVPTAVVDPTVRAVRRVPLVLAADDGLTVGQKLVLQLYEECDALVPPAPRQDTTRSGVVLAADLSAGIGGALPCIRLPFHGRQAAVFRFQRIATTADVGLVIVGINQGEDRNQTPMNAYTQKAAEFWWNGGAMGVGAAPTITAGALAATRQCRQVYVGGAGDGSEAYEELIAYVYGPNDAGNTVQVSGAAYGERKGAS